jgi:hypothetical protein
MRHVHEPYIANYFQSVRFRNNRRDLLVLNKDVVRDDSRDEKITTLFRAPQEVEVANVEQIIGARRVADADHCAISSAFLRDDISAS